MQSTKKRVSALLASLVLSFGAYAADSGAAHDKQAGQSGTAGAAKTDRSTENFFKEAAAGGLAEVQLGRLAAERAADGQVKQYGEMMTKDHGNANEKLKQLAMQHNVTLPTELDRKHKRAIDKLSDKTAAEFDKAYIDQMVKDHKDTIQLFEKQAQKGKNEDVKQFAAATLPKLHEHLKQAQQLQESVKAAAKNGGGAIGSTGQGDARKSDKAMDR